jgi:hypothetical protein
LQCYRAGMTMFESAKCRARHLQNNRDEAERKQEQLLPFLGYSCGSLLYVCVRHWGTEEQRPALATSE